MNTRIGAVALSSILALAACTSVQCDDPDKVETLTIDFDAANGLWQFA